jgi:hypothetical protein
MTITEPPTYPNKEKDEIQALQAELKELKTQLQACKTKSSLPFDFSKIFCCGHEGLLDMYKNRGIEISPLKVTSSLNTVVTINEIYNIHHDTVKVRHAGQDCPAGDDCP